jgi:hypothetical protein
MENLVVMSDETQRPTKAEFSRELREAYLQLMAITSSYAMPDAMIEGLEDLQPGTLGDLERIKAFCALWPLRQ